MSTVLVRIKPYDPRRGNVCRTYTIHSMKFEESKGWYEVERELAESMLAPAKQPPSGNISQELTPALFDIMEKETAVAMERAEAKKKVVKAAAETPNAMPRARSAAAAMASKKEEKPAPAKKSAKARKSGK